MSSAIQGTSFLGSPSSTLLAEILKMTTRSIAVALSIQRRHVPLERVTRRETIDVRKRDHRRVPVLTADVRQTNRRPTSQRPNIKLELGR
jgi:C4-dicarboxylate-specific signal transduction histidine kinase